MTALARDLALGFVAGVVLFELAALMLVVVCRD